MPKTKPLPVADVSIERLDPVILECQGVLAAIAQAQHEQNVSKPVRFAQKSPKKSTQVP